MSLGEGVVEEGVTLPFGVVVEEREVVEGLGERICWGRGEGDLGKAEDEEGAVGERFLPLPRMRPPQMARRDMAACMTAHEESSREGM